MLAWHSSSNSGRRQKKGRFDFSINELGIKCAKRQWHKPQKFSRPSPHRPSSPCAHLSPKKRAFLCVLRLALRLFRLFVPTSVPSRPTAPASPCHLRCLPEPNLNPFPSYARRPRVCGSQGFFAIGQGCCAKIRRLFRRWRVDRPSLNEWSATRQERKKETLGFAPPYKEILSRPPPSPPHITTAPPPPPPPPPPFSVAIFTPTAN